VEISDRIAGSYCGKLLLDAGADVVKVEPDTGDPSRRFTATGAEPPAGADSPLFSYLNAGKRSVTTLSDDLLAGADIVVVTANRSAAVARGVDPGRLLEARAECVVVSISDFAGPVPGRSDQRRSSPTRPTPDARVPWRPAGPPISIGGELGEYMGGVWAAYTGLALRRRVGRGGQGGHLDMSAARGGDVDAERRSGCSQLLQCHRSNARSRVPSIRARGTDVGIQHGHGAAVAGLRRNGGLPSSPRFLNCGSRSGGGTARLDSQARSTRGCASAPSTRSSNSGSLFPVAARPARQRFDDPRNGSPRRHAGVYVDNPAGFRQPRAPWLMSAAQQAPVRKAPAVGDADGKSVWEPRESVPPDEPAGPPLAGVRIVDFTAFWAGPAATHSLAAFGAEVIKIESIQRPDGIRYSGGMRTDVDDWWEYGWVFHAMNTNKQSVTLDLQSEVGTGQGPVSGPTWSSRTRPAGYGSVRLGDAFIRHQSRSSWRDAGVRIDGPVAGPGRLRADDGADCGPGVGDRPA
jgi:hypothetical protein